MIIGFVAGVFVGTFMGVTIAALMNAAAEEDDDNDAGDMPRM